MRTPALMLQGTGSDVGKSVIAAGLARAYSHRGLRTRSFQPQAAVAAAADRIANLLLLPKVLDSFAGVESEAELVLVQGAGSPADIHLRAYDIANMGFAAAAKIPVVLIGDADRGGVIAQLVGTSMLLEPQDRTLIKGYIVNKFRGDLGLFSNALDVIRAHTRLRCFGILPWFDRADELAAADGQRADGALDALARHLDIHVDLDALLKVAHAR